MKYPEYNIGGSTERLNIIEKDRLLSPGPGHYSTRDLLGGPNTIKYSIGLKHNNLSGTRNPGPGDYNPNDSFI
jgi:hypothetical protein